MVIYQYLCVFSDNRHCCCCCGLVENSHLQGETGDRVIIAAIWKQRRSIRSNYGLSIVYKQIILIGCPFWTRFMACYSIIYNQAKKSLFRATGRVRIFFLFLEFISSARYGKWNYVFFSSLVWYKISFGSGCFAIERSQVALNTELFFSWPELSIYTDLWRV